MALSTYSELQTAIGDFLDRDDLTSVIPTFIDLAEAQMQKEIRHWRMEKRTTLTVDAQYEDVPADWIQTKRATITGSQPQRLTLASQDDLSDMRQSTLDEGGKPRFFAQVGDQIEFFPTPDESYSVELVYFAPFTALSDAAPTNWLLTLAPDAYLYGSLLQSAPYLKDDQRVPIWSTLYAGAVSAIMNDDMQARHGVSGLRMRMRSV